MILVIKHIPIEGPGILANVMRDAGYVTKTVELQKGDVVPRSLDGIGAIVTLGGPMNVYEGERYPFLKDEDLLLKEAIAAGIPVLGICLGGQLVAKACGGRVTRCPKREIGRYPVSLTDDGAADRLFKGVDRTFDVFQWHCDTFDIPEGATLLAVSDGCRNQAFRFGKNAYGLQFHVEVTEEDISGWIAAYSADIGAMAGRERYAVLKGYQEKKEEITATAGKMAGNFLEILQRN